MNGRQWVSLTCLAILVMMAGLATVSFGADPEINPNEQLGALHAPSETLIADVPAASSATLVLPPAAFASDGFDPDGFSVNFAGGYLYGVVESGACLMAPVNVPAGATITSLSVRVTDSNASLFEGFDLYRIDLSTGEAQVIGSVSTPAGAAGISWYNDTTITSNVVDANYAYQLTTCVRPSIRVHGVRIGYNWTTFASLIQK